MNLITYIITALLGLLISSLSFYYFSSRAQKQKVVVIYGLSGSGKTTLFNALTRPQDSQNSSLSPTVTSQVVNSAEISAGTQLLDIPGHPKLSYYFDKAIEGQNDVRGIIFVVDASTVANSATTVATCLYNVLIRADQQSIPVAFAVNKSDVFSAVSAEKVRIILQNAITELRNTKKESLGNVTDADADDGDEHLGVVGSTEFDFDELDCPVQFSSGSALKGVVNEWADWIDSVV